MAKKMYDIRPPGKKSFLSLKGSSSVQSKVGGFLSNFLGVLRNRGVLLKAGGVGIVFVILIGFLVFLHLTARASIVMIPGRREMMVTQEVTVRSDLLQPTTEENLLRAEEVSKEKEISEKFQATGLTEEATKARGTVKVINNYHLQQILVERTRFLSADGKLFYSTHYATIPSGGSEEVEVEAAEGGPEYNVKPTSFSIPGLLGTSRYTSVYAESSDYMEGGSIGEISKVTEADLEKAENELRKKARLEMAQELEGVVGDPFKVLTGAVKIEILEASASAEVGEEVREFGYFVTVEGNSLAYHEGDARSIGRRYLAEKVGEDEKLDESSISVTARSKSFDGTKGEALVDLQAKGQAVKKIDEDEVKRSVAGRTLNEVEAYFSSSSRVGESEVEITPFWVRTVPEELKRIDIKVES